MTLANTYTVAVSRIPDLFTKIRDGQAPDQFTQQLLKDWGFVSSNDRAFIPLLKTLGFLSPDGKPTSVYHDYRDHSRSKKVMGRALRGAYGDIFLIKEHPTEADKDTIKGKFKSFHNVSDHVAGLMARTFLGLLSLADLTTDSPDKKPSPAIKKKEAREEEREHDYDGDASPGRGRVQAPGLHYNIQIHLPASKDVEVYNAIFKSLKEHLLES